MNQERRRSSCFTGNALARVRFGRKGGFGTGRKWSVWRGIIFALRPSMKTLKLESFSAPSFLVRLRTGFSDLMDTLVPYGYEDETGFHYGAPAHAESCLLRFRPARSLQLSPHCRPALSHSTDETELRSRLISFR